MTWTSAFGRTCAVLLRAIVRWLALTKINPNVLTFMGLVVNAWAAFFFGYATAENQRRMFFYAGLIIIGSGFFDLVDGEVARAQNRVTRFGAFFDSVVDRPSTSSSVALTAPHWEWPMTTTRRVANRDAANSTLPT